MVYKKTFTRTILALSICCIILITNTIYVKAEQYYANYIGEVTLITNQHYNPGDGQTRTFDLESKYMVAGYGVISDSTGIYELRAYLNSTGSTVNVGGTKITINSAKYFIDIPGMDRMYFDSPWISMTIQNTYCTYFYIGLQYNVTVTSTDGVDGYTYISEDFADLQFDSNLVTTNTDKLIDQGNKLQEEANETGKGILGKITEFFNGFFDNLGNTVLGWIVPSSEQLTEFLNDVNAWFSARLGFIWYPFSLAIDMVTSFAGGDANSTFKVPALELTLMGNKYKIWDSMTIDMDAFDIFKYVRYFTSVILVAGVVKLAYDKWDEWIGGHGVG